MSAKLLTAAEAAKFKGVSRSAVYAAIADGRLPHVVILGHMAVKESDVQTWEPVKYAGRPGKKGGRPKGIPVSAETKEQISQSQKRRWSERESGKGAKRTAKQVKR